MLPGHGTRGSYHPWVLHFICLFLVELVLASLLEPTVSNSFGPAAMLNELIRVITKERLVAERGRTKDVSSRRNMF